MTKLKKLQQKVKDLPEKKKSQSAIGKIVKKKAATLDLGQKKKETIVQDIISKKTELADQVKLKKGKKNIKLSLKEEKPKIAAVSKKSKSAPKLVPFSKEETHEPLVIAKKGKSKDKPTASLKEKKIKSTVLSKKTKTAVAVSKDKKGKTKLISKKSKIKSKQISAPEEQVISKVLTKKEKSKLKSNSKKVLVPREEKNTTEVVSKKKKNKSKVSIPVKDEKIESKVLVPREGKNATVVVSKKNKNKSKVSIPAEDEKIESRVLVPREEKNATVVISKKNKNKSKISVPAEDGKIEPKTISNKAKRKAESVSQKENAEPAVAVKKAKVLKQKQGTVQKPALEKEIKKSEDLLSKKKKKLGKESLKRKSLEKFVKAVLKVVDVGEQKRKTLFNSERPPLFLMVTCVKIPKTPLHQIRMDLPHSMVQPTDDVALFVKDLKRGRRRTPDDTIQHYEDLLEIQKCKRIKTIIPINQVKTEYRQFEMRRRLISTHDYFLCDGRISGHLAHLLGKTFRTHRKLPTSLHMDKKDLKAEIDRALKRTSLQIHSNGDTYVTQFATCSMSEDKIVDNLMAVIQDLSKNFPGGWDNIRSLRIKSPLSLAIPIYMTLKNKNEVEVPVIEPKRPKAYKSVEGELSTFTSNVNVIVAPDGTVDVQNLGNDSDEDVNLDDLEKETEDEAAEDEVKGEEESEDEDDEEKDDDDEEEDEDDEDEDEDENESDD